MLQKPWHYTWVHLTHSAFLTRRLTGNPPAITTSTGVHGGATVVGVSNSTWRKRLTVVFVRRERRDGAGTDLYSVCQWSHPRIHARRCGTWPPSGPSAWPCCCGWHRAELLPSQASLSPLPGSPPVTGYRSFPSLAEQAAYGKHSCQSQRDTEGEREKKKEQESRVSGDAFFLCPGYLLQHDRLGHLSSRQVRNYSN